jgi:hypothetical protein
MAVWTGTAYYPLLRGFITVRIPESGTFCVEETEDGTWMSHAVWIELPNDHRDRFLNWLFTTVLMGKPLYDAPHKELIFFKERLTSTANRPV